MRYINADKLIAEIERLSAEHSSRYGMDEAAIVLDKLEDFITSLQQEQPIFKVGDTIHKKGENTVFPMIIEGISDGDYVCDGGKCFVNIKFQDDYELVGQEWPEVDLERDAVSFCYDNGINISPRHATAIALHFYNTRNAALEKAAQYAYESWMGGTMDDVRRDMVELGKVLNARKEESVDVAESPSKTFPRVNDFECGGSYRH